MSRNDAAAATPLRHLTDAELADLAGRLESEHLSSCGACSEKLDAYRRLFHGLLDEVTFEREVEAQEGTGRKGKPSPILRDALARTKLASATADQLVAAATDAESLRQAFARWEQLPQNARGASLVYACQRAARLVSRSEEISSLFCGRVADAGCLLEPDEQHLLSIELLFLRSQIAVEALRTDEGAKHALGAREAARELVDGFAKRFALGRADYFEGAARGFGGDLGAAATLLEHALVTFVDLGDQGWIGRAEAALGVLALQRGDHAEAAELLEMAVERLSMEDAPSALAGSELNLGGALINLGRLEEASHSLRSALELSFREGLISLQRAARMNLAQIDLLSGAYEQALTAYTALGEAAPIEEERVHCALYRAEALGLLGRRAEMLEVLEMQRARADCAPEALGDLFRHIDHDDLEIGLVRHVRKYFDALAQGRDLPYQAMSA